MTAELRLALGGPLAEELCRLIEEREPRVRVLRDHSVMPRQRHGGDHVGDPSFVRTPEQQERFESLLLEADALYAIPGEQPALLAPVLERNPRIRWVHTTAAGGGAQVRAARLDEATLERVAFTTSAGVHEHTLAEFALFGVLAGAKTLPRLQDLQRRHEWGARWEMRHVRSMTVTVVGLGHIGRRVASVFAALGARVLGVHRREVEAEVERIVPVERLADALAESDAVVLALPSTAATRGMLSRDAIAAARPGIVVVNVGRGSTVDEPALVDALREGRVAFAALDVFAHEPLPAESPLWDLPNVIVSPHTAAMDAGEDRLIAELVADNARRLLDGEPLVNRVDTVELY